MDGKSFSNGNAPPVSSGPGSPHDWRQRELNAAQVTFWDLL